MLDNKLTDNEIIKACNNCLHYEACKGTYYSAKGDEDILYDFDGEMYANSGCEDFQDKDLINRQKTENENLKVENQSLRSAANSLKMHYEEAQAEIERLKTNLNVELENFATEYDNKIKAEAIKEFAERLKDLKHECGCNYRKKPVFAVTEDKIDNLLKELVGEENASKN